MPQSDLIVENATFPAVRLDINNALQALGSVQSGGSAPTTTYPCQMWADTTTNLLKIRNTGNTAWVTIGRLNTTNLLTPADIGAAPLNAPALTGNATLVNPPVSTDNSASIATTAFIRTAIASAIQIFTEAAGVTIFLGSIGYALKYNTTVANINATGFATVPYPSAKAFTAIPVPILSNGDSNATSNAPVLVQSGTSATSFNIFVPGFTSGAYRVNWVAIGPA